MKWESVELLGYTYYSEKGYRILVPLVKNHCYDFVATKNNKYIRVNVKLAGLKNKKQPNSWSISKTSGKISNSAHPLDNKYVDIYLAYIPSIYNKFIELPKEFLHGGNSKSRIIPKNLYR